MVAARWISGVFLVILIAMLVIGKTFTPLNGTRPLIVGRDDRPGLYWTGIAFWAFLLAIMVWASFKAAP
jgi:hypothetical protein